MAANAAEAAENNIPKQKKIYKNDFCPLRELFLWGWDGNGNPGFVVLYGSQGYKKNKNGENELDDNVVYTDYMVFSGAEGHFPSFEAVKILDDGFRNESVKRMYFKRDIKKYGYWYRRDKNTAIMDFVTLNERETISFPYFAGLKQEDYVKGVQTKKLKFINFRLADQPNDVLKLSGALMGYYDIICELFSNPNIYLRKKYLKELIDSDPPKELYDFILNVGSGELLSGLFLELSMLKRDMLKKEAGEMISSNISWLSESYAAGLQRCASIYLDSLDDDLKNKKIESIRKNLPDMDLHLLKIDNGEIANDKVIEGAIYRKYAYLGYFSEYYYYYSREERKTVKERRSGIYPLNVYSDGVTLNINNVKNTIQEAAAYGLADVIGKIAYYLDAPRLTYYFKGNSNYKTLMYLRRYCRRVIDSYALNDSNKFMEAMKALLGSYTKADYLCKFKGNFQFNYFIKHYLYHDFKEKAPEQWEERYEWMRNDQLLKLEGRYEFARDIWDKYLDDLMDIAPQAEVADILKAFYYILRDNRESLLNYPLEKLIKLIELPYDPVSELFLAIVNRKLENENGFDINIMTCLINCPDKRMHDIGLNYFQRTEGRLSVEDLAGFMFFNNIADWADLLGRSVENLNEGEYILFLNAVFENIDKFTNNGAVWTEELKNIFYNSTAKINSFSRDRKAELLSSVISELYNRRRFHKLPDFIIEFMAEIIFSIQLAEIENILDEIEINDAKAQTGRLISAFLNALKLKILPSDSVIAEILAFGAPKMIKALMEAVSKYKEQLATRFSTLLIMLESDVAALNEAAKSVFDSLPQEEQKKLHSLIIDSPDKKTYEYGLQKLYELYEMPGELIPEDFIVRMLEHSSVEVKQYIAGKLDETLGNLGGGNKELFIYYAKTLLFLPNRVSKSKNNIYQVLPAFVGKYRDKVNEIEQMLLAIGGSNIIADAERALVALAQIRREVS